MNWFYENFILKNSQTRTRSLHCIILIIWFIELLWFDEEVFVLVVSSPVTMT